MSSPSGLPSDGGGQGSSSVTRLSYTMRMIRLLPSRGLQDSLTIRRAGAKISYTRLRRLVRGTTVKRYFVWVGPIPLPLPRTLFLKLLAIQRARRDMVR